MDRRQVRFLAEVVGEDGVSALSKAAIRSPELANIILPRVVLGWVDIITNYDYSGTIPGLEDTNLSLKKSETGFDYSINFGPDQYNFKDVGIHHLAGSVAVALGHDVDFQPPKSQILARLGTSIDLLVKSRILRSELKKKSGGAMPSGSAAAPKAAVPALEPQNVQAKTNKVSETAPIPTESNKKQSIGQNNGQPNRQTSKMSVKPITLPGTKPRKPTIKVTKAESEAPCGMCGRHQFKNNKYSACFCFSELSKSVRTIATDDGYVLEFGNLWDADAISTLASNFGK